MMVTVTVPDTIEPVAEIQLERARAVRALMMTGADRATAEAAVAEQVRHAISDPTTMLNTHIAVTLDTWASTAQYMNRVLMPAFTEAVRSMSASFAAIGNAYRRANNGAGPPGHPTAEDDRWAAVIEQKRSGSGSGPAVRRGRPRDFRLAA